MQFYTRISILLTVMAIEASCDCGRAVLNANTDIFPWHVYIYNKKSVPLIQKCGGTLISSSVVITAAHCFNRGITGPILDDLSGFTVLTGKYEPPYLWPGRDIQESGIKTLRVAMGYKRFGRLYVADIAWLILQQPFNLTPSLSPACLDLDYRQDEGMFQSMRSGEVRYWQKIANSSGYQIKRMKIITYSHNECESLIAERERTIVTEDAFCSRFLNVSGIYFDNGGGFFSKRDDRWFLRGVVGKTLLSHYTAGRYDIFLPLTNVGRFVNEITESGGIRTCGKEGSPAASLIARGSKVEPGGFPWHVAIYEKNSIGFYNQICGGSLISFNIVVSAAHCFYDETTSQKKSASSFAVAAGKHNRHYEWPERFVQKSAVGSIHLPIKYYGNAGLYAEDIAWLILQHPFNVSTFVRPICLVSDDWHKTEELRLGRIGKVAGWGRTADDTLSLDLQKMNAPYIAHEECILTVPLDYRPYLTTDKFCAGYLNGSSLCEGDSGSGLAFENEGRWYLRGIVSNSPRQSFTCGARSYTAFTYVGRFNDELFRLTNISTYDLI